MTIIYFIYGLAFFSMGFALFIFPKRESELKLTRHLWMIALFGIVHGLHEWIDLFILIGGSRGAWPLEAAGTISLSISFFFLVQYGAKSILEIKKKYLCLRFLPAVLFMIWAIIFAASRQRTLMGDIWARYLLGVPGAFLTAYAMILRLPEIEKSKLTGIIKAFKLAITGFFLYGLTQVFVPCSPETEFFPASILNSAIFLDKFGIPVFAVRTFLAVVIAWGIVMSLNIFYWEVVAKIENTVAELVEIKENVEKKVKERTFELSILYAVANSISYTLNQEELIKRIMELIFKVVGYDICGALLFSADTTSIFLTLAHPECVVFADEVKDKLIASASTVSGEDIRAKKLNTVIIPSAEGIKRESESPPPFKGAALQSFFNVPFVVQNKVVGMLEIANCKERSFDEENVKIFYTIVNQASNALERLRLVVAAEKLKMDNLVESMTEGVIMLDVCKELIIFNPKGRELLGFGLKEEVDTTMLQERLKTVMLDGLIEECWAEGNIISKETTIPHGEENIILYSNTAMVRDIQHKPIGVVMILRDVTKERAIDNMKTEFVSVVSHELRTPLSILKEGIGLVLDKVAGPINDKQERFLGIASSNIDRLTDIINNLLNISKIEAGKLEFKKQLVDLADLIEKVILSFELKAKEKGLELRTDFPEGNVAVYADADTITQVFINLINNALKFTEHGYITVSIREKEDVVECMVADVGRGISHEDLPHVFGKFQQFDRPAGGAGEKGTGLGLAITKGIVERHKGKIWVESERGKGTKFIFTLPKYTAGEIFKEYVNNGIAEAVKKGTNMSLIIISIGEIDKLMQELSRESLGLILKDMEEVLKKTLRREGDVVVKDTGEVVVLLADCPKDNVEIVKKRLEQALEDYLTRGTLAGKINLRFGCATYPDEAKNDEELIEKAKNSNQ